MGEDSSQNEGRSAGGPGALVVGVGRRRLWWRRVPWPRRPSRTPQPGSRSWPADGEAPGHAACGVASSSVPAASASSRSALAACVGAWGSRTPGRACPSHPACRSTGAAPQVPLGPPGQALGEHLLAATDGRLGPQPGAQVPGDDQQPRVLPDLADPARRPRLMGREDQVEEAAGCGTRPKMIFAACWYRPVAAGASARLAYAAAWEDGPAAPEPRRSELSPACRRGVLPRRGGRSAVGTAMRVGRPGEIDGSRGPSGIGPVAWTNGAPILPRSATVSLCR